MLEIIILIGTSFILACLYWGAYLFIASIINYLYEIQHFKVDRNGKLTIHKVWWAKYFGIEDKNRYSDES